MNVTCALSLACKARAHDPGPDLQIVSETHRIRIDDPLPRTSPFFDGQTVTLVAARGETLAFQVWHRALGTAALRIDGDGVVTRGFSALPVIAKRSSTRGMYGATHGRGAYPDILLANAEPATSPALFEVEVANHAAPGKRTGTLVVAGRTLPVELTIVDVTLPPQTSFIWAYYDPRELTWAKLGSGGKDAPSEHEKRCIATFARYGVTLSPDIPLAGYAARKELLGDFPFVPVLLPKDPALVPADVRGWIAATRGSGKLPFSIPIDEPRKPDARAKVKALSSSVRAAGGGPSTFLYAVTAKPHPELGDAIDLHITLEPKRGDRFSRWTYNGAPPRAGSFLLDTLSPGARTWGWIGHRYDIAVWYVWDALYWHDRHNRRGAPLPGRALDFRTDSISFDDGEDRGNLDGVLALPGDDAEPCRPTLRLATIRRATLDRRLIDAASRCDAAAAGKLVDKLVPRALGDVPGKRVPGEGKVAWPQDDAAWENARRELLRLASCR